MKLLEKLRKHPGQTHQVNPPRKSWFDLSSQECVDLIQRNIDAFFEPLNPDPLYQKRTFVEMVKFSSINNYIEERYALRAEVIEVVKPIIISPITSDQKLYQLAGIHEGQKTMPQEPDMPEEYADDCKYFIWLCEDGTLVLQSIVFYSSPDLKEYKAKFLKFRPFCLQELVPVLDKTPNNILANYLLQSIQAGVGSKLWKAQTILRDIQTDVEDLGRLRNRMRVDNPRDMIL